MEKTFWKVIIEITQVPDGNKKDFKEISWLSDPFGDKRIYCTTFSLGTERFSWKFIFKENSQQAAIISGNCFLTHLRALYPGVNGNVKVKPINNSCLKKLSSNEKIYQFFIPPAPYLDNRFSFIGKIIQLYEINATHKIIIYIFWQPLKPTRFRVGNLDNNNDFIYKYELNYKLQILCKVKYQIKSEAKRNLEIAEFYGNLLSLTTESRNLRGNSAILREEPDSSQAIITRLNPTFSNYINLDAGILNSCTYDYRLVGKFLDFTILPNMPIAKADIISRKKLNFSPIEDKNVPRIFIGYAYINDVLTNKRAYIGLNDLVHHLDVFGLSGVGKSYFLAHIVNQISTISPSTGILIINLRKKNEDILFQYDLYLNYGSDQFQVPYYFENANFEEEEREKYFELLAQLLVSSVGMKNVVATNMENVISACYKKNNTLPRTLKSLFVLLLEYFKKYPYHEKYQTNIMRAIENRVLKLLSSPILGNTTKSSNELPLWFLEWKRGKKIFIDLSSCKMSTKRLLVNLIFQTIRIHLPEINDSVLKHVIIMDEVGEILEYPKSQNTDDDEYITRFHLENVSSYFLQALRSRGVSVVQADQDPLRLFQSVYSLPSIKVLFRLSHSSSPIFSNDPEEQDSLALLRNRDAILYDGVNGKKFAFRTENYFYQNPSKKKILQADLNRSDSSKSSIEGEL